MKGIREVINNPHRFLKDRFLNILCGSITDKSLVIFHVKSFFSISNLLKWKNRIRQWLHYFIQYFWMKCHIRRTVSYMSEMSNGFVIYGCYATEMWKSIKIMLLSWNNKEITKKRTIYGITNLLNSLQFIKCFQVHNSIKFS